MQWRSDHRPTEGRNQSPNPCLVLSDRSCPERMLRRRGKISSSVTAVDRISECPDSVLVHILSFLKIEEAIKTQVLSKRWRFLWTYLPSLVFDYFRGYCGDYVGDGNDDDDDDEGEDFIERKTRDFVVFVEKSLFSSDCKLEKFKVDFHYYPRFASNVDSWIQFAAAKGVEELSLSLLPMDTDFDYELPQLLYDYSSVKELHFSFCSVLPKGNPTWYSLKKLVICYVGNLSNDAIERILGGSPVLEILELHECNGFSRLAVTNSSMKKLILRHISGATDYDLEISAPYLLSLEMSGYLGKNCQFTNVSSLVDVVFNCDFACYKEDQDNGYGRIQSIVVASLASFFHVKNITLGTWAIQVLSVMEASGLSSPLLNCECLTLDTDIDKHVLPGIANLFNSTPNVKALIITSSHSSMQLSGIESTVHLNFNEEQYWGSQKWTYKWLMLHLKTVTISRLFAYQCDSNLFSFLQILLRNARVLQKMVISTPSSVQLPRQNEYSYFDAAKKLLSFPRSSPDAVVLFYFNVGK